MLSKPELFGRLAQGHAAGITVLTPNRRLSEALVAEFDADLDDYSSILAKALADRLAEASFPTRHSSSACGKTRCIPGLAKSFPLFSAHRRSNCFGKRSWQTAISSPSPAPPRNAATPGACSTPGASGCVLGMRT